MFKTGGPTPLAALSRWAALGLLLMAANGTSLAAAEPAPAPAASTVSTAVRLPWTRGAEAFLRDWRVLGPVSAEDATDAAAALLSGDAATPGSEQTLPSGRKLSWVPRTSWTDPVDLSDLLSPSGKETVNAERRYLFARATLRGQAGGKGTLSIGSDGRATVWLNGQRCAAPKNGYEAFSADARSLPVTLQPGDNEILVRLEGSVTRPLRFSLRSVAPGAVLHPLNEISPALADSAPGELAVRTDARVDPTGRPVHVTVFAPAGRRVAEKIVPRGETFTLADPSLPDGPYEVRCSTETAWEETEVTWLSWYKGDAVAAAQRAIEQASRARGPARDAVSLAQRAVADILADRLGGDPLRAAARPDLSRGLHAALMESAELELERAGKPARIRAGGFYRVSYIDPVDGSAQYARAYLPPQYSAAQKWPLVVSLHGYNPPNPKYPGWWSVDSRHHRQAERHGVIVLEPHGRGNAQYVGLAEQDVLRSIDEALRVLSVDPNRVYLTGESMGGSGTWLIGSRHSERFAAIAPVFGGWDLRVVPPSANAGPAAIVPRNAFEDYVLDRASSFRNAEQLLGVPVFIHHGDSDLSVNVDGSRHIARQLQRWGYDVRYREMPGLGHEDLGVRDNIFSWFLQHRREVAPKHVRIRSLDLLGAAAHWLQVRAFVEPARRIVADAEVMEPGLVRLDSDNVAEVRLSLPRELLPKDGTLRVIWNGQSVIDHAVRGESVTLSLPGTSLTPLVKRPGVEGPISDLIRTPFVVVVGTSSADPAMRQRCREKADAFRSLWENWQHVSPRVVEDTQLTSEDEGRYSLLLIGGADANRVSARLGKQLPVSVHSQSITIDGRTWERADAVAQLIYPSPANPERYVMVVAATSANGLQAWSPALWHPAMGFPTVDWDWVVQDRPPSPDPSNPSAHLLAAGLFDASWRRHERWTMERRNEQGPADASSAGKPE